MNTKDLAGENEKFFQEQEEEQCCLEDGRLESRYQTYSRRAGSRFTKLALTLSFILNLVFLLDYIKDVSSHVKEHTPLEYLSTWKSPYSGLEFDTQVRYTHSNDHTSSNRSLADEAWEKTQNLIVIQVSEDWAETKLLPHSWTFPWDLDKRVYFPKVGHQLHCLKTMRKAFNQLWDGEEVIPARGHIMHCLDALRQDLMCYADDTPMATLKPDNGLGENQLMQCKNWDKFIQWAFAPERNACYKHINAYKGVRHPIERYAFCEEESEHFPVMQEYFRVHGHEVVIEDWG